MHIIEANYIKSMSTIDYAKAYITHNDGKSLATIDENNNFVDLGTFVDGEGNALDKVYGLALARIEKFI